MDSPVAGGSVPNLNGHTTVNGSVIQVRSGGVFVTHAGESAGRIFADNLKGQPTGSESRSQMVGCFNNIE